MKKAFFLLMIILALSPELYSQSKQYVTAKPKRGDAPAHLLRRHLLPDSPECIARFYELNNNAGKPGNPIIHGQSYLLPIKIVKYNGKSIRSTLRMKDYKAAKSIEIFNLKVVKAGLKKEHYKFDKMLWVPDCSSAQVVKPTESINENIKENLIHTYSHTPKKRIEIKEKPEKKLHSIFGKKYQSVKQTDNKLDGCVYYLVSGHGGPDPGAVGTRGKYELHEDEYAYDVTLRLARRLMERGAKVYIIVQDPNDGIRDEHYLKNSFDEIHLGGDSIPSEQVERLKARVDIINKLYEDNKATARLQQYLEIHVDSRYTGKRIDVFFYHSEDSQQGIEVANTLLATVKNKYRKAQPGRGYEGTVSSRSLYMLRHTIPAGVYIELGNIQNPQDQIRLIEPDNRQAVANWLCQGLVTAAEK